MKMGVTRLIDMFWTLTFERETMMDMVRWSDKKQFDDYFLWYEVSCLVFNTYHQMNASSIADTCLVQPILRLRKRKKWCKLPSVLSEKFDSNDWCLFFVRLDHSRQTNCCSPARGYWHTNILDLVIKYWQTSSINLLK